MKGARTPARGGRAKEVARAILFCCLMRRPSRRTPSWMSRADGRLKEEDVAGGRTQPTATVGVVEHGNAAVLVTVLPGGELLDRRSVDLTYPGLLADAPASSRRIVGDGALPG